MVGWKSTATTILMGTIAANVAIVQVVDAKALTAKEVYDSANQFVVKIDGDDGGSGFIVRKNGNRYTVLTNDHVTKTSNKHTITTHDGKTYTSEGVRSFKSANGLDLAEIEFESDDRYQVAQLASQPDYSVGTKVYTVGWNASNSDLKERSSRLLEGTFSGFQARNSSGYTLTMNLIAVPGMSGSPLLDSNGKVIGIYGQANQQERGGSIFRTSTSGIQISNYRQITSSVTSLADTLPIDSSLDRKPRLIGADNGKNWEAKLYDKGFKLAYTITVSLTNFSPSPLVVSADANILVVGGGKELQARRINDGAVIYNSNINDYIKSLAISDNGQILAIGTDRGIEIRKTSNGEIIRQIDIDNEKAGFLVAISGNGNVVAECSGHYIADSGLYNTIKIYRISDGKLIRTITAKSKKRNLVVQINSIDISPDGRYIAGGIYNDGIKVWQVSNGRLMKDIGGEFRSEGFSQNSKLLFTMHENPTKLNPNAQPNMMTDPDASQTIKSWAISNNTSSIVWNNFSISGYSDTFASDNRIFIRRGGGVSGMNVEIWKR
jgi:WD40 repeat protein